MTGEAETASAAIVCPHCAKPFEAELLQGAGGRHRGYKCPHCRLFVPVNRADAADHGG